MKNVELQPTIVPVLLTLIVFIFFPFGIIDINPMFRLFNVGYIFPGINLNRKEQYKMKVIQSFHTLSPFFGRTLAWPKPILLADVRNPDC